MDETRKGVVIAIGATISTAITIGLETWIGPLGAIAGIILIAVIVAVILRHVFNDGRGAEVQEAACKSQ